VERFGQHVEKFFHCATFRPKGFTLCPFDNGPAPLKIKALALPNAVVLSVHSPIYESREDHIHGFGHSSASVSVWRSPRSRR
jgi:hypothetical protein